MMICSNIIQPKINDVFFCKQKNNAVFCHNLAPLKQDTISFKQKDLLKQPAKKILETAKSCAVEKNLIGEGGDAKVYKIDENYCLRILRGDKSFSNKIDFNINEQDKINHVVAKLGNKGSSIMKYIKGVPVLSLEEPYNPQIAQDIAQMPVCAYNKLLKQICKAVDTGLYFDCNWTNVIVNAEEKSMTAIDFFKPEYSEEFQPLQHIYTSLVHHKTSPEQKKTYAGKILLAGLQEFEPNVKPCLDITEFDFKKFINELINNKVISKPKRKKELLNTFSEISDLKSKEIQTQQQVPELEEKLELARTFIKQLFKI